MYILMVLAINMGKSKKDRPILRKKKSYFSSYVLKRKIKQTKSQFSLKIIIFFFNMGLIPLS